MRSQICPTFLERVLVKIKHHIYMHIYILWHNVSIYIYIYIYIYKDRIAMGSVLGPIFYNFYMLALEKKVFNTINRPNIYLRYVDDIYLFTNNTNEINIIQGIFQNNPVLNFTQELNINNKTLCLGVLIDASNINKFTTSTYNKKKTSTLIAALSISIVNAPSVLKEP